MLDAGAMTRRGLEAVRDGSHHVRERALDVSDRTIGYIKDEPIKAVLYAAAVGAAVILVSTLLAQLLRRE